MGVGELLPVMSLSTSTECSVPLPALVRRSKEQAGLDGEGCGQHKPTAALGQHSRSTAVGHINCAESQIRSARRWGSLIFDGCARDSTFGVEMICTGGASLSKKIIKRWLISQFGLISSYLNTPFPHAICFICCPLCLLLGFHTAHTNCFICQPTSPSRRSGHDTNCGPLANSSTGCQQQLS